MPEPKAPRFRTFGNKCSVPGARCSRCATTIARTCGWSGPSRISAMFASTGSFDDEVGLYDVDKAGNALYNFSYVDQIYDGLLDEWRAPVRRAELHAAEAGVATRSSCHAFWYKPNISPPTDYARWGELIHRFAAPPDRSLRDRRGGAVVLRGVERTQHRLLGRQAEPGHLFRALRPYRARHQGGEQAAARRADPPPPRPPGSGIFIQHCRDNDVPLDFVSTHVYANDTPKDVFGDTRRSTARSMVAAP